MKEKVTKSSLFGHSVQQEMLESLTGKHNTEYSIEDWHSFGSDCTNACRNHTHLEAAKCIIHMDETKPRIMK